MIKIDTKDLKRLEADLGHFRRGALPYAQRNALNSTAFEARKFAQEDVEKKFILRNKFIKGSFRVDMARGSRMVSKMGSIAPAMAIQETGGTETAAGKYGHPIATPYSSGEGEKTRPRRRLPRRPNQIRNINLQKTRGKGSRKQRNVAAVRAAAKSGKKHIFLRLKRSIGYFKVVGGKRKPRIKMLHNLTKKSVTIPKRPTVEPAANRARARMPLHYRNALRDQAKRFGLFT